MGKAVGCGPVRRWSTGDPSGCLSGRPCHWSACRCRIHHGPGGPGGSGRRETERLRAGSPGRKGPGLWHPGERSSGGMQGSEREGKGRGGGGMQDCGREGRGRRRGRSASVGPTYGGPLLRPTWVNVDQGKESSVLPSPEQDEFGWTPENAPPSRPSKFGHGCVCVCVCVCACICGCTCVYGCVPCAVRALCEKLAVLHHREFGKFRRLKGRH